MMRKGAEQPRAYLRCDWSELVVAVEVELTAVRVAAEVQRLIPVDGKAQDAQEEHPHRTKEQGVELANHRWRPELDTHTHACAQKPRSGITDASAAYISALPVSMKVSNTPTHIAHTQPLHPDTHTHT